MISEGQFALPDVLSLKKGEAYRTFSAVCFTLYHVQECNEYNCTPVYTTHTIYSQLQYLLRLEPTFRTVDSVQSPLIRSYLTNDDVFSRPAPQGPTVQLSPAREQARIRSCPKFGDEHLLRLNRAQNVIQHHPCHLQ